MIEPPDTAPVAERHRFDERALAAYLQGAIPGFAGDLTVRQFAGGQSNPTFFLTVGERHFVLRKKPPGKLLPSAHAVDREYRVITALGGAGFPVPKTYCLCEDEAVIGQAFYVMEWVPGRIFRDPLMPGETRDERCLVYESLIDTLARLHQVDPSAIGLADYGRAGNYFERQIARWTKQYEASKTTEIASFDRLIAWLPTNIPPGDETAISHGDFRLENMVVHPTEPRIEALLDWELSTLGHPLADLGYLVMPYFTPPGMAHRLADVDLAALGIPDADAIVARYCARTGRERIDRLGFYVVFALFRGAAIVQGIAMRAKLGTASAENAAQVGQAAAMIADAAWQLVAAGRA